MKTILQKCVPNKPLEISFYFRFLQMLNVSGIFSDNKEKADQY